MPFDSNSKVLITGGTGSFEKPLSLKFFGNILKYVALLFTVAMN